MIRKSETGLDRRRFIGGAACLACALASNPGDVFAGPLTETPARFWAPYDGKIIQCGLCFRRCLIEPGKTGHCKIRINRKGKLFTQGYGNPGAVHVDPIEKKPLYHVLPGTTAFSIATVGCNIDCKFCQNWQIAQAKPGDIPTYELPPDEVAEKAGEYKCKTIAYTYSEPTVWAEYVMDSADAGNRKGIHSVVISNGAWSPEALKELLPKLKAIKVDFKSIEPAYYRDICGGELQPILENLLTIRKSGVWLELVNLVVTTLNDKESNFRKMAVWVKKNLGTDVPLHFTRFHPQYLLKNLPPTPVKTLDMAHEIARAEGLHFVYVGNVPGHKAQNTLCPGCGTILIERTGFKIRQNLISDGKCPGCKTVVAGEWT